MHEIDLGDLPATWPLLDVRESYEWDAGHAPQARHIPLGELPARVGELDSAAPGYVVVCRSGARSARATAWLEGRGIAAVNLAGGMQAWEAAGMPTTGPIV